MPHTRRHGQQLAKKPNFLVKSLDYNQQHLIFMERILQFLTLNKMKIGLKGNGIQICGDPPKENGTYGNGLSKEKLAKYQKEQDEANAKVNEANPASQFKQPTRLGASSSKPPLPSNGIVG